MHLTSLLAASGEARTAAGNGGQAATTAKREGDQANEHIAGARGRVAEGRAAVQAGMAAEASAAQAHDRLVGLAAEANSTAP